MTTPTAPQDSDDESPETLPQPLANKGDGGLLVPDTLTSEIAVLAHNHVAERLIILIDSLFEMVSYRDRGCSIGSSLDAARLLLGLVGIHPLGVDSETAAPGGLTINTHGPTQVNAQRGPDRLTQELIDIVRKGNNGKGEKT